MKFNKVYVHLKLKYLIWKLPDNIKKKLFNPLLIKQQVYFETYKITDVWI